MPHFILVFKFVELYQFTVVQVTFKGLTLNLQKSKGIDWRGKGVFIDVKPSFFTLLYISMTCAESEKGGPDKDFLKVINVFHGGLYGPSRGGSVPEFLKPMATCDFPAGEGEVAPPALPLDQPMNDSIRYIKMT